MHHHGLQNKNTHNNAKMPKKPHMQFESKVMKPGASINKLGSKKKNNNNGGSLGGV